MRVFVYKRPNGLFTMTHRTPLRAPVFGAEHDDLYVPAGDPIGRIDLCPAFVTAMLGDVSHIGDFEGVEASVTAAVLRRLVEIPKIQ